jgi:hypothetical protein
MTWKLLQSTRLKRRRLVFRSIVTLGPSAPSRGMGRSVPIQDGVEFRGIDEDHRGTVTG